MSGSSPTAPATEAAAGMLAAMSRALEGVRLLGSDHAAVVRACDAAACASMTCVVTVAPDGFELQGDPLPARQTWQLTHERLRALDVALLAVERPVPSTGIRDFTAALSSPTATADSVNMASGAWIRLTPIDYSRLSTSGSTPADGDALRGIITSMLTEGGTVGERAASIDARFAPGNETAFGAEFAKTAAHVESLPPSAQEAALANLRPLIATLGDRFRAQLLNPANASPASWRVLASVADSLPTEDIQRALQTISDQPVQLSVEAAAVFAKLATTLPADASPPGAIAAKELACEVLCADEATLAQRIGSVLRVHHSDDFSPHDYRERIVTLASSCVTPGDRTAHASEFEPAVLRTQFARALAAVAVLRPESTGVREELLARSEDVIAAEGPELFLDLADGEPAAREHIMSPGFIVAALASPACAEHHRSRLTARCGPSELAALLQLLAQQPSRPARIAASTLMSVVAVDQLGVALANLGSATAAFAALSMVQALPEDRSALVCRTLMGHAESEVRAEAVRIACSSRLLPDAEVTGLLNDPADVVAAQLVQVFASRREGDSIIASVLEKWPSPDARFDLIAQSLLSRESGPDAAASLLNQFTRSADRAHSSLADRLAAHLRPHKGRPAVAAALRRHRLSLARIIALIFPEGTSDKKATKHAA